jgi:uncharacterized membrane protein
MDPNNQIVTPDDGKTVGIISYMTIIGWLIAYFGMHQNKKTSLGSYQLRQTLLLHIISFVVYFALNIVLGFMIFMGGIFFVFHTIIWVVQAGFLVLWIIGLMGAINGEEKPIPLIGARAQTMFPGI